MLRVVIPRYAITAIRLAPHVRYIRYSNKKDNFASPRPIENNKNSEYEYDKNKAADIILKISKHTVVIAKTVGAVIVAWIVIHTLGVIIFLGLMLVAIIMIAILDSIFN